MNFLNSGLIFVPEVFILCKKYGGPGAEAVNLDTLAIMYIRWSSLQK